MKTLSKLLCSFSLVLAGSAFGITTFNVTNTNDAGAGSLRQAITDANAAPNVGGNDIISFAGIGAGVQTITITSTNLIPTDPVTIDGTTAPGQIVLDGLNGGGGAGLMFSNAAAAGSQVLKLVIISSENGIVVNGVNSVTIQGCWIGIDATGSVPPAPGNRISFTGVYLVNADNCVIGGTAVASRNVLSGCDFEGIYLSAGSDNNQVIGNYLGVGTGGNTDVGNGQRGVRVDASNNNVIGGTTTNHRNIISGNDNHGIYVQSSTGTTILSNYIGLGADGTTALGNGFHGIILNASTTTVIGALNSGNKIASNAASGVSVENVSNFTTVFGNYIGTDFTGTAARANMVHGVNINNSTDCLIQANLISGNTFTGINVTLSSHRPTIKTNIIGLSTANAALGNMQHGIYIEASDNAEIGGAGYTDRNIISSNGNAVGENGISIVGCNNHTIKNNFCGTDFTGKLARGNYDSGISLTTSAGNTIGGATLLERNVTSAHGHFGMFFDNVDNTTVQGNYIGTDSTGNIALGNGTATTALVAFAGVQTQNGCDLMTWQSNVVCANQNTGLNFLTITNSYIFGNKVGIGLDGITDLGNAKLGLRIGTYSTGNIVGGTGANQRNFVSGNGDHAIFVDYYSTGNTIRSNYCGSDVTGLIAVPNAGAGIFLMESSDNNIVGGTGANEGNLTCCSTAGDGIRTQISSSNTIYGNLIGVNKNGAISTGFGNAGCGIQMGSYWYLSNQNNSNIIGGLAAGQANIITQNALDGVRISVWGGSNGTNFNPIIGNKIYCNGGLGINQEANLATENQGIAAPVITFRDGNTITGTGAAGNTVHVYRNTFNDGSGYCDCEGEIYVGSTTVTAGGTWSLTHGLGLATAAQYNAVTATQTNGTNSTSEFASCTVPLPVTLVKFEGSVSQSGDAILHWFTSSEIEFSHFTILRSIDGSMFTELEIVPAKGSGSQYQYTDVQFEQKAYYKLAMIDKDGKIKYSAPIQLNEQQELRLSPNPSSSEVRILGWSPEFKASLLNIVGEQISEVTGEFNVEQLPPGVYIVQVVNNDVQSNLRLIVE